ncbi:hypothetical protein OK074_6807 [Actinobacteria bacterium OK074]|nr:hypothetical protein OK074_6807 [Actinobacteria bacterium OK074]
MAESVPLRCPACRREQLYEVPSYPCACGSPVVPEIDASAVPAVLTQRVWDEEWVTVRCAACGRDGQWPRPESGCSCGVVLRVPVTGVTAGRSASVRSAPARPAFRPVAIRTARDAVTDVALYLRWLGHQDVRRAYRRQPNGVGLAARAVLAQVDPGLRSVTPRDVECLWLTAMTESVGCVYFSLCGYMDEAQESADLLGVPLFLLDGSGTVRPVNGGAKGLCPP